MTEAEWQSSREPQSMLAFLCGKVSDRALRRFLWLCARELWGAAPEKPTQVALQVVERLAESVWPGGLGPTKLVVASGQAVLDCTSSDPLLSLGLATDPQNITTIARSALPTGLISVLEFLACIGPIEPSILPWRVESMAASGLSLLRQAQILRDSIHCPIRPLYFQAVWRQRNGGACLHIARSIYDEQTFDEMPILADALMDAGCDDDAILEHCRSTEPHIRGCWLLDCILRKA